MAKRAALYLRTSTDRQTTENQRKALVEAAERHGWAVTAIYDDNGVSGAKGRDKRPQMDAMLKAVTRKEFDVLMAWSVDRLGRSLQDLVGTLGELHAKGVDLYLDRQGIDTTTPAGKAMFGMMGVFAEFEREMIRERVNAGLERARAKGTRLGRPGLDSKTTAKVRKCLDKGLSIRATASECGVGVGTVHKFKAAMAA